MFLRNDGHNVAIPIPKRITTRLFRDFQNVSAAIGIAGIMDKRASKSVGMTIGHRQSKTTVLQLVVHLYEGLERQVQQLFRQARSLVLNNKADGGLCLRHIQPDVLSIGELSSVCQQFPDGASQEEMIRQNIGSVGQLGPEGDLLVRMVTLRIINTHAGQYVA